MQIHRDPNGKFRNPWPHGKPHGLREVLEWVWRRRTKRHAESIPAAAVARTTPVFPSPRAVADEIVITWIGHSSFLLQIGSSNILLDPIWSRRASPVRFAGPKRVAEAAVPFDSLPPIDLVLISHDHYDHLDVATVRMIAAAHPRAEWIVPLGVASWLRSRAAKVAEMDWWQSVHTRQLDITCTPAQHFSGRRPGNRDSTLWCGWVVRVDGGGRAVFFAGDTGRHPEFASITRQLGPFDAALLPIGAYDPRWFMKPVHMSPEEAVSAYCDIVTANAGRPCRFIATHWGTFRLTDEPIDEPPVLTRAAWSKLGLDPALLWIPMHGETLTF